ncbi:unnamed protein product [Schistocephalus solidus]|uniref:E3 ubiquitin-protein ligase RNF6 n=1 Tax=Schistocephalus solidus TaxID=70667 RepID=A0A183SVP3_SCHSO|nr:unnamed protein product [Schistocephalus solidus]
METSNLDDFEITWTPSANNIETVNYDDQNLAKQVYELLSEDQLTFQPKLPKPTAPPASQDATRARFSAFPRHTSPPYLVPRQPIGMDQYAFRPGFNEFVHPGSASASMPVAGDISSAALTADYGSQPPPGEYLPYDSPHAFRYPGRIPLVRRRRYGGYRLHRAYAPLYLRRWNHPWRWPMRRRRRLYPHEKPLFYPTPSGPQLFDEVEEPLLLGPKPEMESTDVRLLSEQRSAVGTEKRAGAFDGSSLDSLGGGEEVLPFVLVCVPLDFLGFTGHKGILHLPQSLLYKAAT